MPFARSNDFAFDKAGGEPCRHLAGSACSIHPRLMSAGMRGCVAYDCLGAGQQVVQVTYAGRDLSSGLPAETREVFVKVSWLHEMQVLLREVRGSDALRREVRGLADGSPEELVGLDVDAVAARVGPLLRAHSAAVRGADAPSYAGLDLLGRDLRRTDLRRADLRSAVLVAADLRGCVLERTDLLGADLRDADLTGADLRTALFLTQPQLAAARGDATTLLPTGLRRPATWG
nr:pentapeptide repeat-containing protein [Nocardioides flavescens]